MADEGQGTSQTPGEDAMSRPGRTRRVSNRVPPVIEGRATDVSPPLAASEAPNPPPEEQVASDTPGVSLESADAPALHETAHVPPPDGPVTDAPMPIEPAIWTSTAHDEKPADEPALASTLPQSEPRKGRGALYATAAVIALLAAGATWMFATDDGRSLAARYGVPGAEPVRTAAPTTPAPMPPVVVASRPSPLPASPMGATSPTPTPSSSAPSPLSTSATSPASSQPSFSQSPSPVASRSDTPPTAGPSPTPQASAAVSAPSSAAADTRLAEIDKRLGALDGRITAISAAPQKAAPETTAALNAQDGRLVSLEKTLAGFDKRLASIESQLAPKAETRAPQAPDVASRETDTSAARIVVAQGLLTAVTIGAPYRGPLDALRALGAEDASLTKLSGSADSGVPTVAALRESFSALRPKLRTQRKSDPNASWLETMRDRVVSFVVIRPVGQGTGPSAEAVSSRVDAALSRGDLSAAVTEARAFPAADAPMVKDWLDAAMKRIDAEAAARALVASALASLSKPKS